MSELASASAAEHSDADAADLLRWLGNRDAPCPLCGYNLRGLTTTRCPECGQELRLGVSLVEPYLKAWVALLIALLLPAGVGVLWVVAIAHDGPPRGRESGMMVPICYHIATIPLAAFAVFGRRRILQWPRRVQAGVATVAGILCVVSFAWLFSTIR